MTSRDFVYWLQGYLEIASAGADRPALSAEQTEVVQKHLALVFIHEIDPSYPEREKLDDAHAGAKPTIQPSGAPAVSGVSTRPLVFRC